VYHYFQVGPTTNPEEFRSNVEFLNATIPYVHPNPHYYRGGNPREFQDTLLKVLSSDGCNRCRIIIAISGHSSDTRGNFPDRLKATEFSWDPERFWNGLTCQTQTNNEVRVFDGLKTLLETSLPDSVVILCAQCYGAYFADCLREVIKLNPTPACVKMKVIGLSTTSVHESIHKKVKSASNRLLLHWLQNPPSIEEIDSCPAHRQNGPDSCKSTEVVLPLPQTYVSSIG